MKFFNPCNLVPYKVQLSRGHSNFRWRPCGLALIKARSAAFTVVTVVEVVTNIYHVGTQNSCYDVSSPMKERRCL